MIVVEVPSCRFIDSTGSSYIHLESLQASHYHHHPPRMMETISSSLLSLMGDTTNHCYCCLLHPRQTMANYDCFHFILDLSADSDHHFAHLAAGFENPACCLSPPDVRIVNAL